MFFQILLILPLTTAFSVEPSCQFNIYGGSDESVIKPSAGRVIFGQTGGNGCLDLFDCYERIDDAKVNGKFIDNFFIGEDGNVFGGLGWDAKNRRYDDYANDLSVVFIGDYGDRELPDMVEDVALKLVQCGKDKGSIQHYYSIYTFDDFNCTNKNEVLLNGIVEKIENWPRYAAGGPLITCPSQK